MEALVTKKPQKKTIAPARRTQLSVKGQHTAVRSVLRNAKIQTKLHVGRVNDKYEQEADLVADSVMRWPGPVSGPQPTPDIPHGGPTTSVIQRRNEKDKTKAEAAGPISGMAEGGQTLSAVSPVKISRIEASSPLAQRLGDTCAKDKLPPEEEPAEEPETTVQPFGGAVSMDGTTDLEDRLNRARGRGSYLTQPMQHFFEQRMGYGFGEVRLHDDNNAHALNQSLGSLAFTSGRDIFFGAGQFKPGTASGNHLIAHELTHVVQQKGGAPPAKSRPAHVQRRVNTDARPAYYSSYGPLSGAGVHKKVEDELLKKNASLVVEAPIPGANRKNNHEHNRVGWADLYKSGQSAKVTGIAGTEPVLADLKKHVKSFSLSSKSRKGGKGRPAQGPRIPGWKNDFARNINIGEIKPASLYRLGGGIVQVSSYAKGYKGFVDTVDKLRNKPVNSPSVTVLNSLVIPAAADFRKISTQDKTEGKGAIIVGDWRYWIWPISGGLWVYLHLPRTYREADDKKWRKQKYKDIETLAKELKKRDTRASGQLKARPGARPRIARPTIIIQTKQVERPASYWKNRAEKWEGKRARWAGQVVKVKDFKKKKSLASGIALRAKWEEKLGIKSASATGKHGRIRQIAAIRFWAGPRGKFIGKLRFKFGRAFDRLNQIYENLKEKFRAKRSALKGTTAGGLGFGGPAGKILKLVLKAAKRGLKLFLQYLAQLFATCLNGSISKVLEDFTGALQATFAEQLAAAELAFCTARKELIERFESVVGDIDGLVKAISAAQTWGSIIANAITAVRVGAQAIACLSPPAFGCLWGLVAQLGIGAALDLVIGTQWFNDNVINPALEKVVSKFIEKPFYALINKGLSAVGVPKRYQCEARAPKTGAGSGGPAGSFMAKGGISSRAGLLHKRAGWEHKHNKELIKGLQGKFKDKSGKPAKARDLKALIKAFENMSPKEIKAILDKLTPDAGGQGLPIEEAIVEATVGSYIKALDSAMPPEGLDDPKKAPEKPDAKKPGPLVAEAAEVAEIIKQQEKKEGGTVVDVIAQPPPPDWTGEIIDRKFEGGVFTGGINPKLLLPDFKIKGKKVHAVGRVTIGSIVYRVSKIEVIIDSVKGTEAIEGETDFELVKFEFHSPGDWGVRAENQYYKGGLEKKRIGKVIRRKP